MYVIIYVYNITHINIYKIYIYVCDIIYKYIKALFSHERTEKTLLFSARLETVRMGNYF